MSVYRTSTRCPKAVPSLWQRLLCTLKLCFMELEYIERTREADIWHHRCPFCERVMNVADEGST